MPFNHFTYILSSEPEVNTLAIIHLFIIIPIIIIQWRLLCSRYQVAQAYMEDVNARVTVFAPVNDVFLYNPDLRAMDQKEVLSHIGGISGMDGTKVGLWLQWTRKWWRSAVESAGRRPP
jgi:hypothetical protein